MNNEIHKLVFVTLFFLTTIVAIGFLSKEAEGQRQALLQRNCIEQRGNWIRIPVREGAIAGEYGCQFNLKEPTQ